MSQLRSPEVHSPLDRHLPVLDGIRTLAILLVVGLHSNVHMINSGYPKALFSGVLPFQGGWVGVPLFFILSGFLIGNQLWREVIDTGEIRVWRFFLRRGFRIWPLYYFIFLLSWFLFSEKARDFWSNIFFVANYLGDYGPIRGAWSLSTEEQFYLLFPTLLFISLRYLKLKTLKSFRYLLIFLLLLAPLSRFLTWFALTRYEYFDISLYRFQIYRPLHTHFDGLIVGLLISNIRIDKSFKSAEFFKNPWVVFIFSLILGLGLKSIDKVVFNFFALAIIFGGFTWLCLNTNNIIVRFLSLPLFLWTAKLSYGVYVIHHLVLWTLEEMGWFHLKSLSPEAFLLMTYFITFTVSCALSFVTYKLIEKPFLRLRDQLLSSPSEEIKNSLLREQQKSEPKLSRLN